MAAVENSGRFASSDVGLDIEALETHTGLSDRPQLLSFPALKRNEDGSPRRLAATFTRKRNVSELIDTTTQHFTTPHEPLAAAPKCPTTLEDDNFVNLKATKPKRKQIRLVTERRREQCRTSQARFRLKQRGHIGELERHIHPLRKEVEQLTIERNQLCYGAQTKRNAWSVVVEYFRLFRNGYHTEMSELKPTGASSPATSLHDRECFLRRAMSPDVAFGEMNGVDALIEQWKRYSTYFGDLHFQLEKLEQEPSGIMAASATLSLTITVMTMAFVFPHLLSSQRPDSGAAGDYSRVIRRLLGQRLDCRCSIRFLWDKKSRQLTRLYSTMNWLAPLLQLLGSLEDVNCVLEKAHITPSHLLEKTHTTPLHLAVDLRGYSRSRVGRI
ncbi:hypothetical protein KRP22_008018 [Phytophthora ramorum]|nr:bZIP transcription factor 1 [Phytophthora ramorum]